MGNIMLALLTLSTTWLMVLGTGVALPVTLIWSVNSLLVPGYVDFYSHIKRIWLAGFAIDADTREVLTNFGCDELELCKMTITTEELAEMLVYVNVGNVVFNDCSNVNIEELRVQYPAITFNHRTY